VIEAVRFVDREGDVCVSPVVSLACKHLPEHPDSPWVIRAHLASGARLDVTLPTQQTRDEMFELLCDIDEVWDLQDVRVHYE